jgi:apolipoprotein D and lipocalin family protein
MRSKIILFLLMLCSACTQIPNGVTPVQPFDLQRYLGQWHEIARLDHSFEQGLTDVSALYSLRDDGGVKVLNRGYNTKEAVWEDAEGKAYFVGDTNTGRLKVSFFGPFYGAYTIARLEDDYSMALVIGPSLNYAWLLARSTSPSMALCQDYLHTAERLGIKPELWIQIRSCTAQDQQTES